MASENSVVKINLVQADGTSLELTGLAGERLVEIVPYSVGASIEAGEYSLRDLDGKEVSLRSRVYSDTAVRCHQVTPDLVDEFLKTRFVLMGDADVSLHQFFQNREVLREHLHDLLEPLMTSVATLTQVVNKLSSDHASIRKEIEHQRNTIKGIEQSIGQIFEANIIERKVFPSSSQSHDVEIIGLHISSGAGEPINLARKAFPLAHGGLEHPHLFGDSLIIQKFDNPKRTGK